MSTFDLDSLLLLSSILMPLMVGTFLLFGASVNKTTRCWIGTLGFGWPLTVAVLLACIFEANTGAYDHELRLPTGLQSIGIYLHLGLNAVSMPLFLLAGIVGFSAGLYAIFSQVDRPHLYLALLLFMLSGLLGTFASVDVFFFYFFHEFALIPTFIMIVIWGGSNRRTAALQMTIYLTLGAMLSLLGLVALYISSGAQSFSLLDLRGYLAANPLSQTVQNNVYGLLLFGFGILVSLFPFHSWAPKGYATAPTGAAMLHAGVLKKFGLYGLLQLGWPLLPLGAVHWFQWIIWLALANIIIIGLITIAQRDVKLMLGYSSVMHMGYAFLGIATFSVVGAGGVLLLLLAHGLSVALLFMLSTCIYQRSLTLDMQQIGGLATKAPLLAAFFIAATMASIGLPGFGNFWGEFTIFVALAESASTRWVVLPAAIGIIISAIYGLRASANIFFGLPSSGFTERLKSGAIRDLELHEKLPATILIIALVVLGIFPRVVSDAANDELSASYSSSSEIRHSEIMLESSINNIQLEETHQ